LRSLRRFLREAEILQSEKIPVGVTEPRKVLLEKDGVQLFAIFRDVDVRKKRHKENGVFRLDYRDCGVFEVASYRLSRILGLHNVPPTVLRTVNGKKGSLQAWVENAMTENDRKERGLPPPNAQDWVKQFQSLWIFDDLIFNDDRNMGNILIDANWKIWMIDATRAFRTISELKHPELVRRCDPDLWEKLLALDPERVNEALAGVLEDTQISSLLARHRLLIEHIRKLVEDRGEEFVFYGASPAAGTKDEQGGPAL